MYQFLGKDKTRETNTGAADESSMGSLYGSEYNTMSPIDGVPTNSTLGHGFDPAIDKGKFEAVPEEKNNQVAGPCPECTRADGSAYVPERNADGSCPPCVESGTPAQETEPKMWLQDKMKIAGAFGDLMGAKKYMPWAAKYDLRTPKPTFMDPTRELAANAEQANIQTQALGQFAGPQALSARSSGVMGLYDQNTISNQQYDNTKRALRNNLLNQTTSGITNMMKTDAMNQIYPQFDVDESIGGKVTYDPTKSRKVKPEVSGNDFDKLDAECRKLYKEEKSILQCIKDKRSTVTSDDTDGDAQKVMSMYGQKGGFMYSDITYPFIL